MKIYGLKRFIRKLEKRLTKEIDYKQEPYVAVDGIEVSIVGDGEPLIQVSVRVGYKFNEQLYQTSKNLEIAVDGNDLEYIAGVFATKLESADFEIC